MNNSGETLTYKHFEDVWKKLEQIRTVKVEANIETIRKLEHYFPLETSSGFMDFRGTQLYENKYLPYKYIKLIWLDGEIELQFIEDL